MPIRKTAIFGLAAVWVPSHDVAEAIRADVRTVRQELALPHDYEFKFSRTSQHTERRERFFRAALGHEFRFVASSIDKNHPRCGLVGRAEIQWASVVSVAAALRPCYCREVERRNDRHLKDLIVIDDNEDKAFLAVAKKKFRELGIADNPRLVLAGVVRFRGSGPDELIQLADMVCGAVGAHLDGNSTWHRMIQERGLGIVSIP